MRRLLTVTALGVALATTAACSGGGSTDNSVDTSSPGVRPTPDLAKFLRLPPATPSACPSTENGTTIGRTSPWANTVDVSVFMKPNATATQIRSLGATLHRTALVGHVYAESRTEAYQEFQRLYTCWKSVPKSSTPPSYRLVLTHSATLAARNRLVGRLIAQPEVDSISCDPVVPCTSIVESQSATPTPTS